MAIHTADAIVLRRYAFRETSVVVTCLTQEFGKLKGLVKGLRAHPNRYRSAMEPLTVNRIVFYDTRSSQLHLISQCELMNGLGALQRDLDTAVAAAFCVDLTDTVVPLEEPAPPVYVLLRDTLERLALATGTDVEAARLHFVLRFLRVSGFHPQIDQCAGCARRVEREGYWSHREGGLLCASCLHEDPRAEPINRDALEALAAAGDSPGPVPMPPGMLANLRERLDAFLIWRLDRPLKTMRA
ncbi:MAG TPA: DNA repair protein RecO [bacterium]